MLVIVMVKIIGNISFFLWLSSTPFCVCVCTCIYVCVCVYVHAKSLQSCPTLCNPMDYSPQAPLSMGFSRQEYWSGLPCPPPGDLPDPGIKPISLMFPALSGRFFTASAAWEALESRTIICKESDWTTLSH